jgi:cobalt-precorrin-6B (C15)-methyltransferase
MKIIKDKDFLRSKVPMTKEEVRTITMSKMALKVDDHILDIGGGSGAMAISLAVNTPKGSVTTIEKNEEAYDLILKNRKKFKANNLKIINGLAPENLPKEKFDKIFVGGTYGKMTEIFTYTNKFLKKDGIIVLNFITIENIAKAIELLKKYDFDYEITQITISKSKRIKDLTLMQTNNTVTIIKGQR